MENERTARRYLKKIFKEVEIGNYEWFAIHNAEDHLRSAFRQKINEGKNIGIISEAGCPGIADPGQLLVATAHELNAEVRPLVGPSAILLALMASGLNGQCFQFVGYVPINENERVKAIKELEHESAKKNCTQIFIETPYRNNQLVESVLKICKPASKFCMAADLTGKDQWIKTKTISEWKKNKPDLHKRTAIFLLLAT